MVGFLSASESNWSETNLRAFSVCDTIFCTACSSDSLGQMAACLEMTCLSSKLSGRRNEPCGGPAGKKLCKHKFSEAQYPNQLRSSNYKYRRFANITIFQLSCDSDTCKQFGPGQSTTPQTLESLLACLKPQNYTGPRIQPNQTHFSEHSRYFQGQTNNCNHHKRNRLNRRCNVPSAIRIF